MIINQYSDHKRSFCIIIINLTIMIFLISVKIIVASLLKFVPKVKRVGLKMILLLSVSTKARVITQLSQKMVKGLCSDGQYQGKGYFLTQLLRAMDFFHFLKNSSYIRILSEYSFRNLETFYSWEVEKFFKELLPCKKCQNLENPTINDVPKFLIKL